MDVDQRIASATESRTDWLRSFSACLDYNYGSDPRGFRAFGVSILISLALVALGYGAISLGLADGPSRLEGNPGFLESLRLAFTLNLWPDVLSLIQTRWLIRRYVNGRFPQNSILLIGLDLTASCIISLAAIWGYCAMVDYPAPSLFE